MLENKLAQLTLFQNAIVVEMFFFSFLFFFKEVLALSSFYCVSVAVRQKAIQHSPTDFTRWRLLHVTYSRVPYVFSLAISLTCGICCCVFLFFISRALLYADFSYFTEVGNINFLQTRVELSQESCSLFIEPKHTICQKRLDSLGIIQYPISHCVKHFSEEDVRKQTKKIFA